MHQPLLTHFLSPINRSLKHEVLFGKVTLGEQAKVHRAGEQSFPGCFDRLIGRVHTYVHLHMFRISMNQINCHSNTQMKIPEP